MAEVPPAGRNLRPRLTAGKEKKMKNTLSFLMSGYAKAGDPGILSAALDTENGKLAFLPACTELENPSWILMHPNGKILYAVEELAPDGRVAVLQRDETPGRENMWKPVRRLPAGSSPCHLSLTDDASFLLISNYMDGTLHVWKLDGQGMPETRTAEIRHSGKGPNPDRQEGPHIHAALYLGGTVYVTDLGLDRVVGYRLDKANGTLHREKEFVFPAGSGPRHMAVHEKHPGLMYVDTEMGGTVCTVRISDGAILQERRVIPEDFGALFRVSSIRFAGDVLYVGSRECNMVTLFPLREDGTLGEAARFPHAQETPRDVWMNDSWCITADEGSCALTLIRREGQTLRQADVVRTPNVHPTCILPLAESEA